MAAQQQLIPAPVKGWDARTALDVMDPQSAVRLDNLIPRQSYVELRRGCVVHAAGLGGAVETLATWNGPAGSKLLAAAGGKIWDVTDGAAPVELGAGFSSDRWQWVQFSGWVVLVNGVDPPQRFNGTALSALAFSGIADPAKLVNVCAYKSALYFAAADDNHFWYLPISNIQGPLASFPLGPLASQGGRLVAVANWSRDSGAGPQNYIAFILSGGDVVIYAGAHPSVDSWAIVGTYRMAPPVGRRCTLKVEDDVLLLTRDGYVGLSKGIAVDRTSDNAALSAPIGGAVRSALERGGDLWGWEACLYPRGQWLLINVPAPSGATTQHVVNSATGAWCRFTGWSARTWTTFGDRLYFGDANGRVMLADSGATDDGAPIPFDGKTAFSMFGSPLKKQFQALLPTLVAPGGLNLSVEIDVDYADSAASAPYVSTAAMFSWGDPWGGPWTAAATTQQEWQVVVGVGRAAAMRLKGAALGVETLQWLGATIQFDQGVAL
jgi:hypothetical protein